MSADRAGVLYPMIAAYRQIFALMSSGERRRARLLLGMIVVMALAEVAGIVSILPFLAVAANPDSIHEIGPLAWLYGTLGFQSEAGFLVLLGVAFLLVMVLANGLAALTMWKMLRFTWSLNHSFSMRLLARYLDEPYAFFQQRNTADLAKNVLSEVKQLIAGVIEPGMQVIARGSAVVLICVMLVAVDPLLALVVGTVLGGAYLLIYVALRRILARVGQFRIVANRGRYRLATEALHGIKELRVLGRAREYVDRFGVPSADYSRYQAELQALGQLPRYGMQVMAMGAVVAVVIYLLVIGGADLTSAIPVLGLYVVAGYRLLPMLHVMFQSVAQVRAFMPVLDLLGDQLSLDARGEVSLNGPQAEAPRLPLESAVELVDVSYRYEGAATPAISGVSIRVPARATIGIVGRTGAGKTTVLDLFLGLLTPDSGDLRVDSRALTDPVMRRRWQANIGYVPQNLFLADDTIAANIAFGIPPERVDMEAVLAAARLAQLDEFVRSLPAGYETQGGERGIRMSGGQRQRVAIARALYHDPDVLVFDEATSALDNETERTVIDAVRRLAHQKTIFIVAHRMSTVRDCDRIYHLDGGSLVAEGSFDELSATSHRFASLTGSVA